MMKHVKLKFNGTSGYNVEEYDQYSLNILGELFITEMRGRDSFDFFYEWMRTPEWNETGGNIIALKKINDNAYIYLDCSMELYESDPEKYSLTIPLDQLIKLSEQWLELKKILPTFIIITEEDNKYTMEASQE